MIEASEALSLKLLQAEYALLSPGELELHLRAAQAARGPRQDVEVYLNVNEMPIRRRLRLAWHLLTQRRGHVTRVTACTLNP